MKRNLAIGAGALLALVAAFLAGRFSNPAKVTESATVQATTTAAAEVKAHAVEKVVAAPVRIRTVTIKRPGGEKVIERVEERGPVTTDRTNDVTGQSSGTTALNAATVRVTEAARRPGLTLAATLALDLGRPLALEFKADPRVSLRVEQRIVALGPLELRAYAQASAPTSNPRDAALEAGGALVLVLP